MTDVQHTLSLIRQAKKNLALLKLARSVALETKKDLNINILRAIYKHTDILIELYGHFFYYDIVLPEKQTKACDAGKA